MTDVLAVDYSFQHPDPAAIKAAGYSAVLRYLSLDPNKNITPGEAGALHMQGLGIGPVWETTADEATKGFTAGASDAHIANSQADAVGFPRLTPIFYAVDEDVPASSVLAYFQGVASVGTRPFGPYGSDAVVDGIMGAGIGAAAAWQTEAWSGTIVSPHADVYQRVRPTLPPIPGGGYDEDVVINHNFPFWLAVPTPAPPAPPAPTPAPVPVPQPQHAPDGNPWTILVVDGNFGGMSARATQWKDSNAQDGIFGYWSKCGLQRHLQALGLYRGAIDGILGPMSNRALQARVGSPQDGIWGQGTTRALQAALNIAGY